MRKQVIPRWALTLTVLLLALAPTYAEKNLTRPLGTTRYGAMVRALNSLLRYDRAHSRRMTLTSIGRSVQGRKLWMVTLGTGVPKHVFYLCRQHGHEPASTEGALAFVAKLVKADDDTPPASYLQTVTVSVVPMANPDGSEAFLRHNARDIDLNRDWIKRSQPETRALYAEIVKLHPDLMTDQHELYPNDTRPDFTEVVAAGSGAKPTVIAAALEAQASVSGLMQAEEFPIVSHTVTDTHTPRLAHRFNSIKLGVPTVLFETNRLTGSGRAVAERAAVQEAFMQAILRYAAQGREALPSGQPVPAPTPSKGSE